MCVKNKKRKKKMYKLSIAPYAKWYAKLDHICGIYNIYSYTYK